MKMGKAKEPREGGQKISTFGFLQVDLFSNFRCYAIRKRLERGGKSGKISYWYSSSISCPKIFFKVSPAAKREEKE